jgi:hypothetical protein
MVGLEGEGAGNFGLNEIFPIHSGRLVGWDRGRDSAAIRFPEADKIIKPTIDWSPVSNPRLPTSSFLPSLCLCGGGRHLEGLHHDALDPILSSNNQLPLTSLSTCQATIKVEGH